MDTDFMDTEFNIWYRNKYQNTRNLNDYFFAKEAYEAGQQSAKPRWIPVTERLPTEKDGKKVQYEGLNAVSVLVKRCIENKYYYDVCLFFLTNGFAFALDSVIAWQPLPEE